MVPTKMDQKRKKKKKNDKRERRKRRIEARAAEVNRNVGEKDSDKAAGIKSNLKTGRFGNTGTISNVKPTQLFADHGNNFKQEYINASVKLKEDDKHAEFMLSFKTISSENEKGQSKFGFGIIRVRSQARPSGGSHISAK